MPYTHCAACGAKALVGATRCPRCQAPFVSYDPKGERVPTVNCPNCGVQRPVAIGVCPNCLMSTSPSGWRLARGLIFTGLAIGVIVAVGYMISRRTEGKKVAATAAAAAESTTIRDSVAAGVSVGDTALSVLDTTLGVPSAGTVKTPAITPSTSAKPPAAIVPPAVTAAPQKRTPVPSSAATIASAGGATAAPRPALPPSVAVPDTGAWDYAVAKTWVRVRSAPSIASEMLRMVDSAQRVRLGPPTNGWRPVRVGVDRGWVDPRLFTVVPAPKP